MGRVHKKKIAQYNKENGDGAVDNSTNGDEKSSDRSRADSDADESIASSKKRTPKSTPVPEIAEDRVDDDEEEEQIDDIDRSEEKKQQNSIAENEDEKSEDEAEPAESTKSSPAVARKSAPKRKAASRPKPNDDDEDYEDEAETNGASPAKKTPNKKNAGRKAKAKPKSKKPKPETEDEADEEDDDDDDEKEYEVKDVVDHKTEKGVSYYLIRWKGYGPNDDTWEEEGTLSCQELIDKFNKKKKDTKSRGRPASKKSAVAAKKGGKKASEDPEKQWEVDKIIDYSEEKKGRVFRIRWKGYAAKFDTWEPEDNLNCDDLIAKFMKKIESQKDISYKELREEPKKTKRMVSEGYLKAEKGARKSKRGGGKRIQYADSD